jgi:hypothetical protein
MSTTNGRSRDRRDVRLEYLEDRNLLSVIKPHGIAAEVVRASATTITSIVGRVVGSPAPYGLLAAARPGDVAYSSHGTAAPVGFVYMGFEHVQTVDATNPAILHLTNGSAVLTTIKGDQITIAYTGTDMLPASGPSTFTLTGKVTGGTGRFNAVTGDFAATGTFAAGKFHANISLTSLVYPK